MQMDLIPENKNFVHHVINRRTGKMSAINPNIQNFEENDQIGEFSTVASDTIDQIDAVPTNDYSSSEEGLRIIDEGSDDVVTVFDLIEDIFTGMRESSEDIQESREDSEESLRIIDEGSDDVVTVFDEIEDIFTGMRESSEDIQESREDSGAYGSMVDEDSYESNRLDESREDDDIEASEESLLSSDPFSNNYLPMMDFFQEETTYEDVIESILPNEQVPSKAPFEQFSIVLDESNQDSEISTIIKLKDTDGLIFWFENIYNPETDLYLENSKYIFELILDEQIELVNLFYIYGPRKAFMTNQVRFYLNSLYPDLCNEIFPPEGICSICMDHIELEYLPDCMHSFCGDCLTGWCHSKVNANESTTISCPECSHMLDYTTVVYFLQEVDEYTLNLYNQHILENYLRTCDDFKWCPKCEYGGLTVEQHCSTCTECGYSFCNQCSQENHLGYTCEEFISIGKDKMDDEVYLNWWWKKNNSKICPKCRCSIEKNGGCSHMTCQTCYYEFCWICGMKYNSGNYVYDEVCNCENNPAAEDLYFHLIPELWLLDVVSFTFTIKRVVRSGQIIAISGMYISYCIT
eukprot:TRINITY_DN1224_c0_g1_i4.p1 TRINITY_DN1224_c0_g1~~TRINITY_DN1224_c0_g1_i4.p1  ORF type:complete len:577 (-),score=134.61 TRINITY_DN1224_c0_g1_i4:714-2444(-)